MSEQNPSGMPPWAKKVDDFGNRFRSPDKPARSRRGEYIWAIIWNVIFLYIVNRVPHWNLEFITERYMVILWILNANLIIQIAGNILMLFFGMRWVRYLVKIPLEAASFVTLIVMYFLYPFDFSQVGGWHWLDWLLPILFIIGMVVSAFSVLVYAWKLVFRSYRE